ncbi:MAG: pyruvate, water dikinase regulatory protein [Coriobacteriia bacterium]
MPVAALTVYILSDSLGETADQVAKAALSQFPSDTFHVVRLPKITTRGQLQGVVHGACGRACIIFYTLAAPRLRDEMAAISREMDITAVDILGPCIAALGDASGEEPAWEAGVIRKTDRGYFERVEALEFAVKHDDGRGGEELEQAEIVLVGVSRTSKTPLSMYLAFKGYRVSNVPLVPGVDPPRQLYEIDPRRIFGLVASGELLVRIRRQRIADLGAYAGSYYDREAVEQEIEDARAVMRRLGCIVVSTEGRAIEETAQDILRHFLASGVEG